jgi:alpha-1,3-glucosyltransferase
MATGAFLRALVVVTALKLLLVPCYKSTDFEVHRNWLAVTGTLPLSRWYVDETSRWTLDYPPLFAWFERALATLAWRVDPGMLEVRAEPYDSPSTTLFQRCTVMASDALLALGVYLLTTTETPSATKPSARARGARASAPPPSSSPLTPLAIATVLVIFHPGLLIVDHVHFQYNGAALGLQLCAMAAMARRRPVLGAALFSALVHTKHVFAVAAPATAAHLLAHHVGGWSDAISAASEGSWRARRRIASRCLAFAGVAAGVTAVSLGPFAARGQLEAVFARLFPFGRGLSHAYWAPNAWALYNAADKALVALAKVAGWTLGAPVGNLAGGMRGHGGVGAQTHVALPTITPRATLLLTLAASAPVIWAHVTSAGAGGGRKRRVVPNPPPSSADALRLVSACSLCAFVFGWHVHEKAILGVLIPAAVAVALDAGDASVDASEFARRAGEYLFVSTAGTCALSPLLFESRERPIKWCAVALGTLAQRGALRLALLAKVQPEKGVGARGDRSEARMLHPVAWVYLVLGAVALEWYVASGHAFVFGADRLEFLPLALTSTYWAGGVCFALARTLARIRIG